MMPAHLYHTVGHSAVLRLIARMADDILVPPGDEIVILILTFGQLYFVIP
jgi:hypothetical protein